MVLDNASIHKSKKKTREALAHHHPRIVPVFLPAKSPELNLIEVRWMWMQRKAIDNSTFGNESDIGQAVSDWTENYNNTHFLSSLSCFIITSGLDRHYALLSDIL
jgi:transposase